MKRDSGLADSAHGPYAGGMFRQVVSERLSLIPLLGLTLFFPFLSLSSPFFEGGDGARELVAGLELAFVVLALFDHELRLPNPLRFSRVLRWALFIWVLWALAATVFSEHSARALVRQSEWFLHLLTAGVAFAWLRRYPDHIGHLSTAVPTGFLLLGIFLVVGLPEQLAADRSVAFQIPGFEEPRHYGYYAVVALAYLTAKPAAPPFSIRVAGTAFVAMAATWVFIFWSGSRGPLVAIATSLVLLLVMRIDPAWKKCIALTLAAALLGAGLSTQLPNPNSAHGVERILRYSVMLDEKPESVPLIDFITNGRARLWSRVAPQALLHPWFGHGPDGYLYSGARGTRTEQPHNLVLQFLFDWGLVGAASMLLVLVLVAVQQIRSVRTLSRRPGPDRDRAARLGALFALLSLAVLSLFDGSLHHPYPLSLAALSFAICAQPPRDSALPEPNRLLRGAYVVVAIGIGFVFALHTLVMLALSKTELPKPGAARVELVRAFPSRLESVDTGWSVFYWSADWAKSNLPLAIDWLHWGHHYARDPWRFYQLEGRLLLASGDREAARSHFEKAREHAFGREKRAATESALDQLDRKSPGAGTR